MRVLGIDPGFHRVGWSVVDGSGAKQSLVECGCLETDSGASLVERLVVISRFVESVVERYRPDCAAVEELYFFKNQKTVMGVGQARGAVVVSLARRGVEVFGYTPLQIKSTIAGYGRAEKRQVQLMVKSQLGLSGVPRPDDAADAVAVALTHFFMDSRLRSS